jgi:hypothetical protein
MPGYRLYRFDPSGHFNSSEVIAADSDTSALRAASELLAGAAGELWLDEKLISRLGKKPTR